MKILKAILWISVLATAFLGNKGFAAFEDIGWTARSKAMGNAMFGAFDGVNSMNYNPATLSMQKGIEVYGSWDMPYAGLNDGSMINTMDVLIAVPFFDNLTIPGDSIFTKRAAFGFMFHRISVGDSQMELYHEGVYSVYYAKDLNDVISRGAKISAGFRFSVYDIGVGQSADVVVNPAFGSQYGNVSVGLDLGITYDFSETIRIGLAYKNLIAPNISIIQGGTDVLPSELRLGANWDIGDIFFMKKCHLGGGIVSYGRDATDNRQADMSYNVGFETKFLSANELFEAKPFVGEMIAVRLGAIYQDKKVVDDVMTITGGVGFHWIFANAHQINVDYAFQWSVGMGRFTHSVGMAYEWLLPNSAFAFKEPVKGESEANKMLMEEASKSTNTAMTMPSVTNTSAITTSTN